MTKPVHLIAAVGRSGQLGMRGGLPWHDVDDLRWFRKQTMGCHVIVGRKTYAKLPDLDGRRVWVWAGEDPKAFLDIISRDTSYPMRGNEIWVAGGARTYEAFMPFVARAVISRIDYDGPADTFMPTLWNATAGGG